MWAGFLFGCSIVSHLLTRSCWWAVGMCFINFVDNVMYIFIFLSIFSGRCEYFYFFQMRKLKFRKLLATYIMSHSQTVRACIQTSELSASKLYSQPLNTCCSRKCVYIHGAIDQNKWLQKRNLIHDPKIKNLSSELKRKLKEILQFPPPPMGGPPQFTGKGMDIRNQERNSSLEFIIVFG